MITVKHTPLPWRYELRDIGGNAIYSVHEPVAVGVAPRNNRTDEISEANAKLIVTAVNSHADLVAALKAMLAAVDGVPCGPEEQARAALAKAST